MRKLTDTQEQSLIEAFKGGAEISVLIDRFRCSRGAINRLLISAGLMKVYSTWQPEVIAKLRELIAQNCHTAEVMATLLNREFQTTYSREAVCGKVNRLGLSNTFKKGRPEKPAQRTPARPRPMPVARPPVIASAPIAPSSVDNADALNITFAQLEEGLCHWPTGEGTFCGHATPRRKSYCAKHQSAGSTPARYSVYGRPINR